MRNRSSLKKIFVQDRKTLYTALSILLVSILTLTVVYAALSTTLNITGNAEVSAASWDIYLDNVQLNSGSATTNTPTITNSTTATFSTTLSKPGDFYEFSIDLVNDGSIDAMIDSVTKTPELSTTQSKYLNYIVEYENGESISAKQLVSSNSFVRLKVRLEFRQDITASDLPQTSETLNLSFRVNYVQSDETGTNVKDDGVQLIKIISGDYDTIGSEICIDTECFYVISSDSDNVTLFAKYNLHVGNIVDEELNVTSLLNPTGIQDNTAKGWMGNERPYIGTVAFSTSNYWDSSVSVYPTNVYGYGSVIYNYVENYKNYLEEIGIEIKEARLITYAELKSLGCDEVSANCSNAPEWVCSTTYWTGTANSSTSLWRISSAGLFDYYGSYEYNDVRGIRPIITISKSEF